MICDFVDRGRLRRVDSMIFLIRFCSAEATPLVSGRLRVRDTNGAIPPLVFVDSPLVSLWVDSGSNEIDGFGRMGLESRSSFVVLDSGKEGSPFVIGGSP